MFNQLRTASFSCGDTELWNHHPAETKQKAFLVITGKEKEKVWVIMCLCLKIDSRIKNMSKMTLRYRVPIGLSLSHSAMDFSASILITVITTLRQTHVLTKKDFLGEYNMNKFWGEII